MDGWAKADYAGHYDEACRLAREGDSSVEDWFSRDDNDFIYFVEAADAIKVGTSAKGSRLSSYKLHGHSILAVIRGGRIEERELHKSLDQFRKRGREWYELDDRLFSYIEWLIKSGFAAPGDDPSSLPRLPFNVWKYAYPLPFKEESGGQLNIFEKMPPRERIRRLAVDGFLHSLSDDWFTEEQWISRARAAMGSIDLDPATHPDVNRRFIKAKVFYTKEVDGLSTSLPWMGNVWLNPPYGDLAPKFFLRMRNEFLSRNIKSCVACCSISAMTTSWFHETIAKVASAFYVHNGRIQFHKPGPKFEKGESPNQGTLLSYVGNEQDRFISAFKNAGGILLLHGMS